MNSPFVQVSSQKPVSDQRVEMVERKGLGHPDTICDSIMENAAIVLCREYQAAFGRIPHFNLDKCLLVAGRTEPRLGGGRVLDPMRLVFGDRATAECAGRRIDIGALVETSAADWLRKNLRSVCPERHFVFQNELKEGSPELMGLFDRKRIGANDTSVAVGYAPLSETEIAVLACERHLNSPAFKERFPAAGEDVKVMAYRRDRELTLTIAIAFVDRCVGDIPSYFALKEEIAAELRQALQETLRPFDRLNLQLNTLDDPVRGESGIYLTVLGTSAESGDGGEVGRGNKVNGLISVNRPLGTEAAAGKNPVSHVGKIYSVLTHELAGRIHKDVEGIREVYVWLGSQIGAPIDEPAVVSVQVALERGCAIEEVQCGIEHALHQGLAGMDQFTERLLRGELAVC